MSSLKLLMPALCNKLYFNYGGQSPLPKPSLDAIIRSWEKIQELGPFTNDVWPYIANEIQQTKQCLADITGVPKQQIALTENVTSGCILPLWGLTFSKGDNLLISDCEHPGVVSACKELAYRKGLTVDILPVQHLRNGANKKRETKKSLLELLERKLTPRTKLVVLSHILWNTGQTMPIKEVAQRIKHHPSKPFLLVDAAQSFGQIPIKEAAKAADIYAFTGHKWACGPEGLGGVALSERILLETRPTIIGWKSIKEEGSIYNHTENPFHLDSRKFEIATSCVPLLAGLRSSLDLLEKDGNENERHKKIQEKSAFLWEHLNDELHIKPVLKGPPENGLISFSLPNTISPKEIVRSLGKKGIWIRVLEDPEWLRACLHVTTEKVEMSKLIEAIRGFNIKNIGNLK